MVDEGASLCIDASVGAKWFLSDENDTPKALRLLEGYVRGEVDLVVPELFAVEVANALGVAARRGRLTYEAAVAALDDLAHLRIRVVSLQANMAAVLALSQRLGVSVYDATYLAVAEAGRIPFVTCDLRLLRAAASKLDWVVALGDLELSEPPIAIGPDPETE